MAGHTALSLLFLPLCRLPNCSSPLPQDPSIDPKKARRIMANRLVRYFVVPCIAVAWRRWVVAVSLQGLGAWGLFYPPTAIPLPSHPTCAAGGGQEQDEAEEPGAGVCQAGSPQSWLAGCRAAGGWLEARLTWWRFATTLQAPNCKATSE